MANKITDSERLDAVLWLERHRDSRLSICTWCPHESYCGEQCYEGVTNRKQADKWVRAMRRMRKEM